MLLHKERDHDCILLTDLLNFSESTPHLKHFLSYDIYAQALVTRICVATISDPEVEVTQ
jgi:hypothetical protein